MSSEKTSFELDRYSMSDLKKMAAKMDLRIRRSKEEMIKDIEKALYEYEKYKKEKVDKYTKLLQLGNKGKEGTTFLVKNKKGDKYAMKTFRKTKATSTLLREYELQKKAAEEGIAPKIYDYDTVGKWILMELMDKHLFDTSKDGPRKALTKKQQEEILNIYRKLDSINVLHGDINLMNYMVKDGKIYLIDYGYSKEITSSVLKKYGENPNMVHMTMGLVRRLKDYNYPEKSWKYLWKHISDKNKEKYFKDEK